MAIKSQHSKTLERLIMERRDQLLQAICAGVDQQTYLQHVGEIRGLDVTLALSEQADRELSGD